MFTKVKRLTAFVVAMIAFSVSAFYPIAYAAAPKTVTLIEEGSVTSIVTETKTVLDFFEDKDIKINPSDILNVEYADEIEDGLIIEIKRAKPIYIPQTKRIIVTAEDYDKEFLEKYGYTVPENEFYVCETYDKTRDAYLLTIVECYTETETVTEDIKNDTVYIEDTSLSKYASEVVTKGQTGKAEKTYIVRYENGRPVSKILTNEVVTQKPIDKVLKVGTKPVKLEKTAGELYEEYQMPEVGTQSITNGIITTSTGKVLNYSRAFNVTATAYDLSYESCGKYPDHPAYGITASGMKARYGVIAVDPRVIPLGTKLYIESPDGSYTYGEAIAGDTGGAIKGNKIDLFFPSYEECMRFGRRTMTVYILI